MIKCGKARFLIVWIIGISTSSALYAQAIWGTSPVTEPYPYVNTGNFSGAAVPQSPDPLVSYRWTSPSAGDGLEIYLQKPMGVFADTGGSFDNAQSLTGSSPNVTVKGTGSIRMDFGRENAAWLEFDSPDLTGKVEMSISEYNEPAIVNSGPAHPIKTLAPTRYGNTYRLELNSEMYEGARFGWIHVRTFTSQWHISGVRLVCQIKPTNYNGSFTSSDTLLTKIWYVGAYDVKLNLEKDYFSALLMDRGDRFSWTGDAHPAQAASMVAFGNFDFVKKNIDNTSTQSNGILSYELYWVLSLIDYSNYTGDTATLSKYIANVSAKLDKAYSIYGTNPSLGFYGHDERIGATFEHPNGTESQNAYKMLSIRAWKAFASAMNAFGRADLRDKYNGYADAKIAALRQNPSWYQDFSLHAAADAATTGLLNNAEKNALFTLQFTDRENRISFSPFNQYFVIQALAVMDKYDDALSSIRDLWGGQIQYGGTTFFETFRLSWQDIFPVNGALPNNQTGYMSLCHAWGAGVVKWLSEEVLGVKPTSPGFKTFDVVPHLGRTLTSVSGKTPTLLGDIRASFNVSTGLCTLSTPTGTIGRIGIPKVGKTISRITSNGALAWDGNFHSVNGIGGVSEDSQFVYFTSVQPGTYAFAVNYTGVTPTYNEPSAIYPARFIGIDSTTSGNWGGVYGSQGSVLFNYIGAGSDKKNLPTYVSSIDYYMLGAIHLPLDGSGAPLNYIWASNVADIRAPAPDKNNGPARTAACLYTANPEACRESFTLTVNVTGQHDYQVALYFLDWDDQGRRVAVEMLDAATLELIAPDKVVSDFHGGKYLVYGYNKSVKFRINHIRGPNAVLSGIFFDPAPTSGRNNVGKVNGTVVNISKYARVAEIAFSIDRPKDTVAANLLDFRGKTVAKLLRGEFPMGQHKVSVELPRLPAGVYILQFKYAGKEFVKRIGWKIKT